MRARLVGFVAAFLVLGTCVAAASSVHADPPYVYADSFSDWSFVGDLDGDGLDEVLQEQYDDVGPNASGEGITLLDGRTGRLLWHQDRATGCTEPDCLADVAPEVRLLRRGHAIVSVLVSWASESDNGTRLDVGAYEPLTGLQQWRFTVPRPPHCDSGWAPGVTGVADLDGNAVDDVVVATEFCRRGQRSPAYVIDGDTGRVRHSFSAYWPVPVAGLLGPGEPAGLVDAPLTVRDNQRAVVTALDGSGRTLWSRPLPRLVGGVGLSPVAVDLTPDGATDLLVSGHDRASYHPYYVGAIDGRTGRQLFHRRGVFGFSEVLAMSKPTRIVFTAIKIGCTENCEIYDVLDGAGHRVWALNGHAYALPGGDIDGDGVLDVRVDTKAGVVRSGKDGHGIVTRSPQRAWGRTGSLDGHGDDLLISRRAGDNSVVTALDGQSLRPLWHTELPEAHGLGFDAGGGPAGSVLVTWGYDGPSGAAVLAADDGHVMWRTGSVDAGVSSG